MGSPLSSPLAEIVMNTIDKWITTQFPTDIIIYKRYIDDIFCICTANKVNHILTSLNNYHPRIKFTMEIVMCSSESSEEIAQDFTMENSVTTVESSNLIAAFREFILDFARTCHTAPMMSEAEDCSICLDTISQDNLCHPRNCMYQFHLDCLKTWFEQTNSCPIFRRNFTEIVYNARSPEDYDIMAVEDKVNATEILDDNPQEFPPQVTQFLLDVFDQDHDTDDDSDLPNDGMLGKSSVFFKIRLYFSENREICI
ncbi:hypothetical protein LAZ67_8001828 [Cordylochernes scorpioides]|uniref:RING-type domain-containing protein n=1 Tax=Cordylochernes scorpioides TaxID=51811 RepID=A0ABY6KQJ1_9ARAC|nr:hypothetical protein LAZ67_8001828 [Cordylochernes scorpioides]